MSTQLKFDTAVELIKSLPEDGEGSTKDDKKLEFYGLFKQAKEGDNTTSKPGMMDFRGKYKWAAWNNRKGMSTEEAQAEYVRIFEELLRSNSDEVSKKTLAEYEKKIAA